MRQGRNRLQAAGRTLALAGWLAMMGMPAALADQAVGEPAWVHKGSGIEGEDLVGVGVAQGPVADERGAYLDALQNMTQVISLQVGYLQKGDISESLKSSQKTVTERHIEKTAKIFSNPVRLAPGVSCALLLKVWQEDTRSGAMDEDVTPSRFAWLDQEQQSQPAPGIADIRQRLQTAHASADGLKGRLEGTFASISRCQVASSETVMARLPIVQRYEHRRSDGSVVSYVQVRTPLQAVLVEARAGLAYADGKASPEDPWGEATWDLGKDASPAEDVIPPLSYTPPVCKESREKPTTQVPEWVTEKGNRFEKQNGKVVFYGVGKAGPFPNLKAQRKMAEALARVDLAAGIDHYVQDRHAAYLRDIQGAASPGGQPSATAGHSQDEIKVFENTLIGSSVLKFWEHPCTGELSALVSIDGRHIRLMSEALGFPAPTWASANAGQEQPPAPY